ncbi:MAG TPA: helicase-related protein [Gemmatimonadaceae bacterium]|nr:helicase-related protein [Gemmatimonadaceae bacterium]
MKPFRAAPIDVVRSVIASAMLDPPDAVPVKLGAIELRDHQRVTAARLAAMVARDGGALLAEPVGLGKTFSALAVAARIGGDILIAAPAALRGMWEQALRDCRMSATIVTHEALSRGARPGGAYALVIVDEAHRVRSPMARRYDALAHICRRAPVLLVTATPVQNRRDDLAAQLALFLGRRAWQMTEEELAQHVARGDTAEPPEMPRLSGPHTRSLSTDDDCLDDLLAIPPPVPARDGSVAAALLEFGLVHQWTSSRAALVASLKRRRARGLALSSALESGRRPTRSELSAWTHGDDTLQLAFPELVAGEAAEDHALDVGALLRAIAAHNHAIESLLVRLRRAPDPDDERAALLRGVCAEHPRERVIAFCQYAETVNVLRAKLASVPGVAALTANGARIASGRVSRDAVLSQFTPRGLEPPRLGGIDTVNLLITTDLLSEGLNLQEASVIVHLDLPWNPARLEQRVGRVLRLGSRHSVVTVYSLNPPVAADRLLRLEQRLHEKLRVAERTVGVAGRILAPSLAPSASVRPSPSLAELRGAVGRALRAWLTHDARRPEDDGKPLVAAAESMTPGWLALVMHDGDARLVADVGVGPTDSAASVVRAIESARGRDVALDEPCAVAAIAAAELWLAERRAASAIRLGVAAASHARRAALTRVSRALARAPRHRQSALAPLAAAARNAATAMLAEGAERVLDTLVAANLPDEAWLRSIAAFGELNARPRAGGDGDAASTRVIALIVFATRNH